MPIDAAIAFDRRKDFEKFFGEEPVGALKWLNSVAANARASGPFTDLLAAWLRPQTDLAAIEANRDVIISMGKALTVAPADFSPDAVRSLGLLASDPLHPVMLRGTVSMVPTTKELGQRLVVVVGQREFPLVTNDDPLECFAGDLSAFAGNYDIAVIGWPDGAGQLHVQEAAPIMALPGLDWRDWAQGRLHDNGVAGGPVVLRVNAGQQIQIADPVVQERLRPFIGTGVVLYGKRQIAHDGSLLLTDCNEQSWFLTRLTNPADPATSYPGAPRPAVIDDRCLCIGATPPWNWQGPNVETHIVAPISAASLAGTEERRLVFGRPASALPPGIPNPVSHLTRVILATCCAEPPINTPAHIATRRAPRGVLMQSLRGITELTSAELAFAT